MPYYFTQDGLGQYGTELAAVHAIRMMPHYEQAAILGQDMFDFLNQRSVMRVAENDHITHAITKKKKGDFDDQDKIPFSIFRPQAIARNFD